MEHEEIFEKLVNMPIRPMGKKLLSINKINPIIGESLLASMFKYIQIRDYIRGKRKCQN